METLLNIQHLSISYSGKEVVHDLSLTIHPGEALSIVGESGCGKSTVLKAVMKVLPGNGRIDGGTISFCGEDIMKLSSRCWRGITGKRIVMLFQQPGSYFDPIRKLGLQFRDFLLTHEVKKEEWENLALESLAKSGFPDGRRILDSYAFQLSGGMRQRAAAAMFLAFTPQLIVLDEPTSALDSASVIHFLNLMKAYTERGTAILFVTHNIRAASYLSRHILVMQQGRVVEEGTREKLRLHPVNPYTRALFEAVPELR